MCLGTCSEGSLRQLILVLDGGKWCWLWCIPRTMVRLNGRQEWGEIHAGTGCTVPQLVGACKVVHRIQTHGLVRVLPLFGHQRLSNHFLKWQLMKHINVFDSIANILRTHATWGTLYTGSISLSSVNDSCPLAHIAPLLIDKISLSISFHNTLNDVLLHFKISEG